MNNETNNTTIMMNAKTTTAKEIKIGDKVKFDFSSWGGGIHIKEVKSIELTKSGKRVNVFFTDGSRQMSNGAIGFNTPLHQ